ncbi:MAG TPA: IS21 family transposase [Burkholderiales bacterium]|nr:IS21 family transposase [Burkholderiales bacterium]
MNVLKPHLRITVDTLLKSGMSHRQIARRTGVDRKTIRSYAAALANSSGVATGSEGAAAAQTPPPRPPTLSTSACEAHRAWIEEQVTLGRNAVAIYQELVDAHGFTHRYNSVKRFVATLKARAPERFDVLEFLPGEEAQVDYGQGAPTLYHTGRYKRPYLFVMTLKYSGKSFRKVVWKTDQQAWARLHEEAWRAFGGVCQYVVLDNLKEGVIRPDIYAPELNGVYSALLAHYGAVADPCRVRDPNRKGSVENAIKHTQATALKGRKFDAIEAQNAFLAHWEERWASLRIHGRKKRQVLEMFREEQPKLRPLPLEGFRLFRQVTRTVDDAGLVQIEAAYYAALPAAPHSEVTVRIYHQHIEIVDTAGQVLRRHEKATRRGAFVMEGSDRLFNPSRESARVLARVEKIGPCTAALARELFVRLGRPGSRAIYGIASLTRTYTRSDIEAVCARLVASQCFSYTALKRALERRVADTAVIASPLTQSGPQIRTLTEYQSFWDTHSHSQEDPDGNVYH